MHVAFEASGVKDFETTLFIYLFFLLNTQLLVCQSKVAAATPRESSGLLSVHQTPLRLAPKTLLSQQEKKEREKSRRRLRLRLLPSRSAPSSAGMAFLLLLLLLLLAVFSPSGNICSRRAAAWQRVFVLPCVKHPKNTAAQGRSGFSGFTAVHSPQQTPSPPVSQSVSQNTKEGPVSHSEVHRRVVRVGSRDNLMAMRKGIKCSLRFDDPRKGRGERGPSWDGRGRGKRGKGRR